MPMKIRPIRTEGDVSYIKLTKGYEALIDTVDLPIVSGFNWCAAVSEHTIYALRISCFGKKRKTIYLHRQIIGVNEAFEVDHKDGNGLNNQRSNIRAATPSQNKCNRKIAKNNTSGFKGVHWSNKKGKWFSQIQVNGKRKSLGYHSAPELAYAEYVAASNKLHMEFGRVV